MDEQEEKRVLHTGSELGLGLTCVTVQLRRSVPNPGEPRTGMVGGYPEDRRAGFSLLTFLNKCAILSRDFYLSGLISFILDYIQSFNSWFHYVFSQGCFQTGKF